MSFLSQPSPLTIASVAKACKSDSITSFQKSINKITRSNAWIDFRYVANGGYHFDNELFLSGRQIITDGLSAVKFNVKDQSYVTAREALGSILHTLQVWNNNLNENMCIYKLI